MVLLKTTGGPKPLASEAKPQEGRDRPNAQYIDGVTDIDRSRACPIPLKHGEGEPIPSLLRGKLKCRECYKGPPCECGVQPHETEVNVYWTSTSKYFKLDFPSVRKCEDICVAEAQRLGMSCVIIRKEQHATFTQRTRTGRKTKSKQFPDTFVLSFLQLVSKLWVHCSLSPAVLERNFPCFFEI